MQRRGALPLELAVNRLTRVPARLHGLRDRGELRPGMAADVCVIDPERLALGSVRVAHDLPGTARASPNGATASGRSA